MKTKIILIFCLNAFFSQAQSNNIDTSYGTQGLAYTIIDTSYDAIPTSSLIQADGKIVLCGYLDPIGECILVRHHPDGTKDSSFGINGIKRFFLNSQGSVRPSHIIQLAGGKLLLGGVYIKYSSNWLHLAIWRLNANGDLDSTFGLNGAAIDSIPNFRADIKKIEELSNGKIMAYGDIIIPFPGIEPSTSYSPFVIRYHPNGTIDTSFQVNVKYSAGLNGVGSVVMIPGHRFIMGGDRFLGGLPQGISSLNILKMSLNGNQDTLFGNNGVAYLNGFRPSTMAVQQNNYLLCAGFKTYNGGIYPDVILTRFDLSGNMDTTFGVNGIVVTDIDSNSADFPTTIRVLPNGDFFVAGGASSRDFIARYYANGMLDTSCSKDIMLGESQLSFNVNMLYASNKHILTGGFLDTNTSKIQFSSSRYFIDSPHFQFSISDSSCAKYIFNGKEYRNSGQYQDTLQTAQGCDSIIYLDLTITPLDNSVTQNGATLTAAASSTSYQWLDCSTNQPIASETSQTYTATTNGSYAVVVTENGCTDTSACYTINNIGIEELENQFISVFPNPNTGSFTIQLDDSFTSGYIEIFNLNGQKVFQQKAENKRQLEVNSKLEKGVYVLKITSRNHNLSQRLIIQ